ncbi:hypothetical protein FRC10_008475 [Ceratobasidium sp. 414]|nr:hypothetical protein FRC10_008475 [Ceratobasidium sp. 414]
MGEHLAGDNEVVGIKDFRIGAEKDIEVLDASEIIAASPVLVVRETFNLPKEKGREKGAGSAKVDVVADEGSRWIRVTTSRLTAEIHELDGYEPGSSESSLLGEREHRHQSHKNSVLGTTKALLPANKHHAVPGEPPRVTIRLTRLEVDPAASLDGKRIARTVRDLETLSIDVQPDERPFPPPLTAPHVPPPTRPRPTPKANSDLPLITALAPNLPHPPLPIAGEDARERSKPLTRLWKSGGLLSRSIIIVDPGSDEETDANNNETGDDSGNVVKDSYELSSTRTPAILRDASQPSRKDGLEEMVSERWSRTLKPIMTNRPNCGRPQGLNNAVRKS